MEILKSRKEFKTPIFLSENKIIWRNSVGGINVELHALSPSDAAKMLSIQAIGELLPEDNNVIISKNRIPDMKQNHTSVALWLTIGDYHFILGSDLEQHQDSSMGWNRVLENRNPN